MVNRYKIYTDLNFCISKFAPGIKSFEEIFKMSIVVRQDKDFSKIHYQLADLRGCTFDFGVSKIKEVANLIDEYQEIDNQKLGVYMLDSPTETAMVQLLFDSLPYSREYCSTTQKAFDLLNLPISFGEFKKLIDI